jgi:pimeloyl-ACP methyl ester carboxylesterase
MDRKLLVIAYAFLWVGCADVHVSVDSASQGVTASITANPSSVTAPNPTTLTWTTTNASEVTIDGIGRVDPIGTWAVSPAQTTLYHLKATGSGGTAEASVQVGINSVREVDDANGVSTWAVLPPGYQPGVEWPWVIYNHGYGGRGSEIFALDPKLGALVQSLAAAGYVVVASNYRNFACWGNAECDADIANLQEVWRANLNLSPKPFVIGESMGGVVTWNAIAHGFLHPRGVVGIYPACSLAAMFRVSALAPSIEEAYDFSSSSQLAVATEGYDPLVDPPTDFTAFPIVIWASYSDTTVVRKRNEDPFAEAINAAGGNVVIHTSRGNHGDASNFDPSAVLAFFSVN